jgi:hypothetical protein
MSIVPSFEALATTNGSTAAISGCDRRLRSAERRDDRERQPFFLLQDAGDLLLLFGQVVHGARHGRAAEQAAWLAVAARLGGEDCRHRLPAVADDRIGQAGRDDRDPADGDHVEDGIAIGGQDGRIDRRVGARGAWLSGVRGCPPSARRLTYRTATRRRKRPRPAGRRA